MAGQRPFRTFGCFVEQVDRLSRSLREQITLGASAAEVSAAGYGGGGRQGSRRRPGPSAPRPPAITRATTSPLRPGSRAGRLRGVTESRPSNPKPAAKTVASPAKAGASPAKPAATSSPRATSGARAVRQTALARQTGLGRPRKTAPESTHRHPNLGLAPIDTSVGFTAAAAKLRGNAGSISAAALEAMVKADPAVRHRYDDLGLRRLRRDGELLVERLALCLASGNDIWLTEYAEWVGPTYRRRRVPQADLGALCAAIRETLAPDLTPDELGSAARALDAAAAVFRRNGRVGGDTHKRNALLKWLYRGV